MSNTGSAKIGGTTNGNYDSYVRNSDVIYALSWSGGVADPGHYPQTSCAFHALDEVMSVGTTFALKKSRASKISFTAGIGPAWIGPTSGHSTSVDMSWTALRGNGLWYRGAIGDPADSPGVI